MIESVLPDEMQLGTALEFDPKSLKEKYLLERDKRLRADGTDQYHRIEEGFAEFAADPNAGPRIERDAIVEELDVVIVGGGFGGLLAGARLREAGVTDVRVIDRAADFGGTWYWNRYPGAACDTESYVYIPLIEEVGRVPTEKYACRPEIFAHAQAIGRTFGLYERALFQTDVTDMDWDEARDRWILTTDRGDRLAARFVCISPGPVSKPKLPGIPGIDRFEGHAFHTSRWDYGYTGGDSTGGMTGLADKRVGIIGTGASTIQCLPYLARSAGHVYVFQRTPSSVSPRSNSATNPDWKRGLKPGWQRARMENFNILLSGGEQEEDLVNDEWTAIFREIGIELATMPDQAEERQLADFRKMERVRANIEATVKDPAVAEALKPYYNQLCKRPCFNDGYLESFNLANVTLVDTAGKGVERVTAHGVIAAGREYALDCLVYGTGFEVLTPLQQRTGFEINGRNGVALSERWAAEGISTLHGLLSRGFPNCFIMGSPQGATAVNFTHILDENSRYIAHVISHCLKRGIRSAEPSEEGERAWVDHIMSLADIRQKYDQECTPGYYNNEGAPSALSVRNGFYPAGPLIYFDIVREWRQRGDFAGLELK